MRIDRFVLHHGDCLDVLREMPENSVDAIVTDPPYGLSFMGKRWDYDVPSEDIWRECLRVLKPGGHLLAFAGTRTQHRMAVRIEDAGFEIRDMIAWVYGSGFPKSLDVSKAIDKAAGAERVVVGKNAYASRRPNKEYEHEQKWGRTLGGADTTNITVPATNAAHQWNGWGTALKPALEPITLARKPLSGTVAANVLTHGTGALNVDGCRVGNTVETWPKSRSYAPGQIQPGGKGATQATGETPAGRWPANFIHDGSDEVVGLFPLQPSGKNDGKMVSAARFFYCAKASRAEREAGLEEIAARDTYGVAGQWGSHDCFSGKSGDPAWRAKHPNNPARNVHPTVKPTALMRYLCRLVTPLGGVVLDPFTGSGSTGKAAMLEGFHFVGIEREAEYLAIAQARIEHAIERAIARDNAPMRNSDDHQKKLFAEIG